MASHSITSFRLPKSHFCRLIRVDKGTESTFDGQAPTNPGSDNVFQTALYSQTNLDSGQHELTLTNAGINGTSGYWVDVDFVVYEATLPNNSRSILLDNNDSAFGYLPSISSWTSINDSASFQNTLFRTQANDGRAQVTFSGSSAVGLYGRMGTENGGYQCQVDDGPISTLSANWKVEAYQQLFCFAWKLNATTEHTITITNFKGDTDSWLKVDFVQLYGPNP